MPLRQEQTKGNFGRHKKNDSEGEQGMDTRLVTYSQKNSILLHFMFLLMESKFSFCIAISTAHTSEYITRRKPYSFMVYLLGEKHKPRVFFAPNAAPAAHEGSSPELTHLRDHTPDPAILPPSPRRQILYLTMHFHPVTMCFSTVYQVKWKQSHT